MTTKYSAKDKFTAKENDFEIVSKPKKDSAGKAQKPKTTGTTSKKK